MDNEQRIKAARGNAVPGGRISSSGAVGATRMVHASQQELQSNGRKSWVGKSRYSR